MRRLAPRSLSYALERVTAELEPATALARVQGCWADAVGEMVNAEARPTSERGGVVTVACRSSVWAEELKFMAADLVERVNGALGESLVEELRFRAGGFGDSA